MPRRYLCSTALLSPRRVSHRMAPPLSDGLKRSHANGYHFGRIVKSNVVRASTLSLIGTTVFLLALGFVERESVFQWTREHSFDDRIERKSQTADSDCVTRQEPQQTVRRFTPLSQLPQCARDNGRAASFLIVFMGHCTFSCHCLSLMLTSL